jgi:hypothetical protein
LEELRQNPRDYEARRRAREVLKKAIKELNAGGDIDEMHE